MAMPQAATLVTPVRFRLFSPNSYQRLSETLSPPLILKNIWASSRERMFSNLTAGAGLGGIQDAPDMAGSSQECKCGAKYFQMMWVRCGPGHASSGKTPGVRL